MIETEKLTKLYYTIGEVAEMFKVNPSLIRFWEKEFPVIQPKKNKKGNRLFTPKDIENFNRIYELVKVKGYTLDGARKALKVKGAVQEQIHESINPMEISSGDMVERLEQVKAKLISLKTR